MVLLFHHYKYIQLQQYPKQVELSSAKLSSLSWVELSLAEAEAELEFDLVWWLKYLKSSRLKLVSLNLL